jgi:hypothetical protein
MAAIDLIDNRGFRRLQWQCDMSMFADVYGKYNM